MRLDYHREKGIKMREHCSLPINQYCTANVNDWFEYKVSALFFINRHHNKTKTNMHYAGKYSKST